MNFISTVARNKKGQEYRTRSTRNANGTSKHYGKGRTPDKMLMMAVYGTFDTLAKQRFDFVWITVMHPTDPSYTKKVRILNKNKRKFIERMPAEERRRTVYKLKG